ncbi:uncharacterized protein LOC135644457 isoform X1 [Musa acuminata AAA Group]|uniref:uncharacterized protein LOC135644457 isoform X1 n=1 Tax=Musa acuminata AAA Group TaxID=214697 RepID=UPI0031CFD237
MGGCLISLGIRKLEDEGYREAVDDEILTRCRLKVCREEGDREAVEKRLGFGQVEELIEEALENLNLIYMMLETRDGRLIWNQVCIIHQVLDLCDLIRLGLSLSGVYGDLSLGLSQLTLGDADLPLQHRYHPNTPINWILHTPVGLQCNSICSLSSLLHWNLLQDIYAH